MNLLERIKAPTPKFWKKVQMLMITVGAVSGAIMAAPVALPSIVVTLAGYGLTAGAVGTALSQMTVEQK